jgi:hypothetical protein
MICTQDCFLASEDGAVTVDWVVLTAACVGLALAATISIYGGAEELSDSLETYLTETPVEELAGID